MQFWQDVGLIEPGMIAVREFLIGKVRTPPIGPAPPPAGAVTSSGVASSDSRLTRNALCEGRGLRHPNGVSKGLTA